MPAPKDPIKYEEWRRKTSEAKKGRVVSQETRAKLSAANKGKLSGDKNPMKRPEVRAKVSMAQRGRKVSLETRKKLSEASIGHLVSPETRNKISKGHKGKKLSLEHCSKISVRMKGNKPTLETLLKMRIGNIGKHSKPLSPEHRIKLSEAHKGKKLSPEHCASLSAANKGEKHWNWKGGISFEPYCENFDEPFHERCREFFGRVCVECGKTEEKNGQKLSVHHVNYDKMVCCNGTKPTFVTLCVSCHTKTNYNKEHWEKHFTDMINDKYGGKCYLPKMEVIK